MGKWNTKIKRNCLICKKEYLPQSNSQKFCNECKKKNCVVCGKEYNAATKFVSIQNSQFCSPKCYLQSRWGNKCIICGKTPKRGSCRFCSTKCKNKWEKEWCAKNYYTVKKQKFWREKEDIIKSLGGKCRVCGNEDKRVLDINHIDRNKKKRPPKLHYTHHSRIKEWKENKENLEILCANCHRIHTWEQMGYGIEMANRRLENTVVNEKLWA